MDKSIEQLGEAKSVQSDDLFVLQQSGTAKRLTGQTLENWLLAMADGHGGIQSIEKVSTSGLVDTYRITLSDTTTTTFTVTNGAKGDKGNQTYVHIRWSSVPNPTNADISTVPDAYIGIYAGTSASAPATAASYAPWYKYKGEKGDTGTPATIAYTAVDYKSLSYGTGNPGEDGWTTTIPSVPQGSYLWTRTRIQFVGEDEMVSYSVARAGRDGSGAVSTVNGIAPENGNVQLTAANVGAIPSAVSAVKESNIADNAVTSGKIASGSVTADKLAAGARAKTFSYEYVSQSIAANAAAEFTPTNAIPAGWHCVGIVEANTTVTNNVTFKSYVGSTGVCKLANSTSTARTGVPILTILIAQYDPEETE